MSFLKECNSEKCIANIAKAMTISKADDSSHLGYNIREPKYMSDQEPRTYVGESEQAFHRALLSFDATARAVPFSELFRLFARLALRNGFTRLT